MSYYCNFFGVVKKNYFCVFKFFFVVYARMPVPVIGSGCFGRPS